MKIQLLIFTICFASLFAQAQLKPKDTLRKADTASVYFSGIKIDGDLSSFISKMESKGFSANDEGTDDEKGLESLSGNFFSHSVQILVCYTNQKQVYELIIFFEKETDWGALKNTYINVKEALKVKYGRPARDYHFWESPYEDEDNNEYKMNAVEMGKCDYGCQWHKPHLDLFISKNSWVTLIYNNDVNSLLHDKEILKAQKAEF